MRKKSLEILTNQIAKTTASHVKSSQLLYPVSINKLRWAWAYGRQKLNIRSDPDFVFHTLSHTFISTMAMNDVPIVKLQNLAGHKSIHATMRYIHMSTNELDNVSVNIMDKIIFE